MPTLLDSTLLDRYLAGECTPDEAARVQAWVAEDSVRRDVAQVRFGGRQDDTEAAWAAMAQRIVQPPQTSTSRTTSRHSPPNAGTVRSRYRVLAYGLGMAVCALIYTLTIWPFSFGRNTVTWGGPESREYVTIRAQRATLQLPDGSQVMLAPDTRLRYKVTERGERLLDLRGEAYFIVPHSVEHPFLVRTGAVTTRVLGTVFDVRHYPTDSTVQVSVVTGRVASLGRATPVVITAGHRAELTDSTATIPVMSDLSTMTGWTSGSLVLTNVPVSVVLETASRWSGYNLRLADSTLAAERVTTVLAVGDRREMMQLLSELLNVTMTIDGNMVTLHPRRESVKSHAPVRRDRNAASFTPMEVGK